MSNRQQTHITISNKPSNMLNEEEFNAYQDEASRQAKVASAAPELLAALESLLNYDNLGAYERAAAMKASRAAIAKAKGGAA